MARKTKKVSMKTERDLLRVGRLPLERFQNEQLAALTVYAIYWLREWGVRPTAEAIAVASHRLFPERFAMDLFPEFPDANRTLRSLLQSGPKYRGWLSGSNRRGYAITPSGRALVDELLRRIGYPQVGGVVLGSATEAPRQRGSSRTERARDLDFKAEISRLRSSTLFERWKTGSLQQRDAIHVYSALEVFDHTPPAAKRRRLDDLKDSAKRAGDQEAAALLAQVEDSFPSLFRQP